MKSFKPCSRCRVYIGSGVWRPVHEHGHSLGLVQSSFCRFPSLHLGSVVPPKCCSHSRLFHSGGRHHPTCGATSWLIRRHASCQLNSVADSTLNDNWWAKCLLHGEHSRLAKKEALCDSGRQHKSLKPLKCPHKAMQESGIIATSGMST